MESYCKDAEDPVQFTEAFFQVNSLPEKKYIPVRNYDYVKDFMHDNSEIRVVLKSRQTGFSFAVMMESIHKALITPRYEKMIVSHREENASWLIGKGVELIENLQEGWKIPLNKSREGMFEIKSTKSRIKALPCTSSAARGFNGDVTLDELAFMPNADQVMDGILQSTVREGRKLEYISTPFGQEGVFYELWHNAGWDVDNVWKDPSQKQVFEDYLYKFRKSVDNDNGYHAVTWFLCPDLKYERIRKRCRTEAIFYQEYCLGFIDEARSLLPYSVLRRNVDPNITMFKDIQFPVSSFPRYIGIDPADSGDNETAIVLLERVGDMWITLYVYHENAPESKYYPIVKQLFYAARPNVVYIDRTGIGSIVASNIQKMIPNARIEKVHLSNARKQDIAFNMVSKFEANMIKIPNYEPLIKQLHALKSSKTSTGMIKLSGKSGNFNDDLVWAFGLALSPSIDESYGETVEVEVVKRNLSKSNLNYRKSIYRMEKSRNEFPFY
ncbi:MAG: terminase large subunit domain-containing protein [Candidatus Nanoarchaeia archaeon]